ncbi:MAG: family 16 glycoside hydrolase [Anaerolineae bacterium]
MIQNRGQRRWLLGVTLCVVVVILLACGAGDHGPWTETFDDVGDWQLSADAAASVAVADGVLRVHVFEVGQVAWTAASRTYSDFHLSVETTQVSGPDDNEYGVLVRMDGDQQFYVFSISGDGYARAAWYSSGTWNLLGSDWMPSDAIHQGAATNVLELEARGTTFVFTVNGTQVLQVEDAQLAKGDIGLYAGAFNEADVVIDFDNLEVQPLQE